MNSILNRCPVCGNELSVTRLHCGSCQTTIEGNFRAPGEPVREAFSAGQLKLLLPFAKLSAEQLQFVITFVRCEGRFKRMEEEMNLSYPTLRNRLDEIIRALGYEPAREDAPAVPTVDERKLVLDDLSAGRITMDEAKRRLRGAREDEANTTVS